ncbi:LexA/Signal peptidase [Metschnikowia bicuspidata var. bicuspidata NRRL YB-4993]|uniref:Mitochondrial inner membrane protease subunit n=1 Tax=Metschnikowia bicuspidata var. bicuspidata NRRL YB-4993 TaxID=869754 RepID=A0A1A0HF12_9ASCO|nr:LexA/Signal peptidase [Metschnikowia bicuspidata var. bicuspidata NRRL YB-4993]OBA22478.1 LexA/Signal peptidase [Metschnikowia bicuspidata var. bicuspidata NRRL YB-4993]
MKEAAIFAGSIFSWTIRAGCAAHFVNEYFYEFTETRGELMLTTLQAKRDFVHALKTHRLGRGLGMGDIVVATKPLDPDHRICKRISGMPGDVILVDPSSSSTLTNLPNTAVQNDGFNKYVEVPQGHVWVTGDNLSHSLDLRSYSWLPMGLIKGKVVAANSMDKGLWDEEGNFSFYNFRWLENLFVDEP